MHLDYLLFDCTDEETGACSFDAMAAVVPARLPALLQEVEAVLRWAHRVFGAPSAGGDGGEWDFELQATADPDLPLEVAYDAGRECVALLRGVDGLVTLTLTVSGSRAFAQAFREAFPAPP